jgi:membrane protein implicated in regulation of membrane protease activity
MQGVAMNIGLEPWHVWTIIALCLFIGEVFVPGFLLASLAIGAMAGGVAHQFMGDLGWGIGGFAVGAGISLLLIRPYVAKMLGPEESARFGADNMVGDVITVTDANDVGGTIKARYRDSLWSLQCNDELFEGDSVVITDVQGATLVVARVNAKEE